MRKKGFTLIELVMVMAIISVIAAIVLPRLDPFVPKRRLKSAARVLSGTISLAYGESISKNKTYRLYMDPSDDSYWITEVDKLDEEDTGGPAGIRLGTHFELLQYEESEKGVEQSTPSEPMFARKKLPEGVHFASVEVKKDLEMAVPGARYIEFNPLGSATPATIRLANEEGERFTVRYDGVSGIPVLFPAKSETG
ncbi:prepilin-type N-terminal cleavage/methylation domain-containing protein [Candidatus Poribacteria bacterium]|nr:prepilin-type N-terminal cleavage/methylation domain-containing protein [Candidatus Poribacteria bacterium]